MAKNSELSAFKSGLRSKGKGKHRRVKMTIPMGIVAGFVPLSISVWNVRDQGFAQIGSTLSKRLTGYDPETAKWNFADMRCGTLAIIGGFLVHWLVGSKLGINRMLGRTGIPLIRI